LAIVFTSFVILAIVTRAFAVALFFGGTIFSCVGAVQENGGVSDTGQFNFEQAGPFSRFGLRSSTGERAMDRRPTAPLSPGTSPA
jgi:hypothetical protein